MTSINDIPLCVLKNILRSADIFTQIYFSMTCKKYYEKLYPSRSAIGMLVNKLFNVRSNRLGKLLLDDYNIGKNEKSYCCICWKIKYEIELYECNICKLGCCSDCKNSYPSLFGVICKKCNNCVNCSKKMDISEDNCYYCGHVICNECLNNITFKCCDNIVCQKCSILRNLCTTCKKPCCYECVPLPGYMCNNH